MIKKIKSNKFRLYIYSLANALMDLASLYLLIRLLRFTEKDNFEFWVLFSFLLIQVLKVLLFFGFKNLAVKIIAIRTKVNFNLIKKNKVNKLYSQRLQDERTSVEILTTSQEEANSIYASYNKATSILTLIFYFIYAIINEPNIFPLIILGSVFYLINKFLISSKRINLIKKITKNIEYLADDIGAIISNIKFLLFDIKSEKYDERILNSFNQIRKTQGLINLINYSVRPLLEITTIVFFGILIYQNSSITEIAALLIIIFKSVPLISQINFSDASIDLSTELNSVHESVEIEKQIINEWDKISFNYRDQEFSLKKGSKIFLKGESGSGKSSLLEMLCGIIKPNFILTVDTENIDRWEFKPSTLKYLNQQLKPWNLSVSQFMENITLDNDAIIFFTESEIERIKTSGVKLNEISGGQFQRLFLYCALKDGCSMIVLDEALSGTDHGRTAKIVDYLVNQNMTLILTSHDDRIENMFENKWELQKS
jgi:ABC-type Mn2+/Zn2+ transport system ATPase subunit